MEHKESILVVNNISKRYKRAGMKEPFWALKEVSFSVNKGEILGVIGRNGAGKSTLLKILSDVISPTTGTVKYNGVVVSILDIGTGFHPDLSGYDNIFLNASLFGMSKIQVQDKIKDIIDFSGIESFIHEPVKNYSNGMYLRLAFSIAVHINTQILLLDEVVAVGDAEFREKCNSKLRELVIGGMTIVLVTHNMSQVLEFCNRCIWIDQGNIKCDGKPIEVIENYIGSFSIVQDDVESINLQQAFKLNISSSFNDFVHLNTLSIRSTSALSDWPLYTGAPIELSFHLRKLTSDRPLELAIYLTNLDGIRIFLDSFALRSNYQYNVIVEEGLYNIKCMIPADILTRGIYHLSIIVSSEFMVLGRLENLANFKVLPSTSDHGPDAIFNTMNTIIAPRLAWEITKQ